MSFLRRVVFAGAVITCLMAACGKTGHDVDIYFDKVNVSKDIALVKETDSPHCKIRISVEYAKNDSGKVAKKINATIAERLFNIENLPMELAVDSFASTYARDYIENLEKLYREDKSNPDRHVWYEYSYAINTEIKRQSKRGIITYIALLDFFEGGAHGISQRLVMNFDIHTGKLLTLNDIFVPGYEARLNEVLLEALENKTGLKSIDDLHKEGYLYSMSIFAPDNFIIGDESLTFIYNVYEIAPYAKGQTELIIDYSDIKELLPK